MTTLLPLLLLSCQPDGDDPYPYSGDPQHDFEGTDYGGSDGGSGEDGDDGGDEGDDGGGSGNDDEPPEDGTGYDEGDVAYDLTALNQVGSTWSLYWLHGRVVILLVGDMDYSSMVANMAAVASVEEEFSGVRAVALVGRDETSITADQADAARYASDYGLSTVLTGGSSLVAQWSDSNPPKTYVIGEDMVIEQTSYGLVSESALSAQVESALESGGD